MKSLLVKSLSLFIGIIVAFVISEGILRIVWNPPYLDQKYIRDDFVWMSKFVLLNNFGYRDVDTTLEKEENMLRIYSLGDSFTFGWYIDDPNFSYPNLLEARLKEISKADLRIEVINAAQPGFKISDSLDRYQQEGIFFSPDIVTLGINLFDITEKEFPPQKPKLKILKDLKLYELTFGNMNRARISRLTKNELSKALKIDSPNIKKLQKNIQDLNQIISLNGGVLILVVFPCYDPSDPNGAYPCSDFHQRLRKIMPKGVKIVDLLDTFETVSDKNKLVLNPTDDHPTILANTLAAEQISREVDINNFVETHQITSNPVKTQKAFADLPLDNFRGIISISDQEDKWVYFDRAIDLGVQSLPLKNEGERQFPFMRDTIKTAKSFTHNGWPGAKLEMNFFGQKEIRIKKNTYGYPIIGLSKFTVYWRENHSTRSRNLDLGDLNIISDGNDIRIKVLPEENFDFFKVTFDIAAKQIDIDKQQIVSSFNTDIKKIAIKKNENQVKVVLTNPKNSLPEFTGSSGNYGYVWINGRLTKCQLAKTEGHFTIEFAAPVESNKEIEIPLSSQIDIVDGLVIHYI